MHLGLVAAALLMATACSGSDSGPDPVTIESIVLAPASVTLAPGASQQFAATGHYSDGSTQSASVTWSAAGGSVTPEGVYTAGATPGAYPVVATLRGGTLADTAAVTIPEPPPPDLVAIEVTPATATVVSGHTQPFVAVGRRSDNSTVVVPVTWSATGGTVSGGGVFTAGSTPGSFTVTATEVGGAALRGSASVTVAAALVAVELSPPEVTLAPGATQQFTPIERYSDNSTRPASVTWMATGGSVSVTGLYTAGPTAGTFRVVAMLAGGSLADTAAVTVTTPPPQLVAIEISPPDTIRIKPYDSTAVTAVARRSDGSTVPVAVAWSSPAGTVSALGNFVAGPAPSGTYPLVATQQGGTLADTVRVTLHQTTGESVQGPNFWTPTPGALHLCTSNHFTDDPVGLAATATITATPNVGVLLATRPYATQGAGSYINFPNGPTIDFVRVVCEKVFELPAGYTDSVKVTVGVSSYSANSGMAKIFTYQNSNNPQGRADFTRARDAQPPLWNTAAVAETLYVTPANGANVWFKNTRVPF